MRLVQPSYRETLPVALQLAGRNVLVLGGGDEAVDKIEKLLAIGARVSVVAQSVLPALSGLATRRMLTWYARGFVDSDLQGVHLVMLTDQDTQLVRRLVALKRSYPFWLCAIDQPEHSDIFLVSIVRRGPLQIGISTGGGAPLLARRVRQALEAAFDQGFADFARRLADLRSTLRALPKEQRKQALSAALSGFAMDVQVSYPEARDGPPE
jgi:siroheme synthase-like protein